MPAKPSILRRRAGTGFLKAMVPAVELGFMIGLVFMVWTTIQPPSTASPKERHEPQDHRARAVTMSKLEEAAVRRTRANEGGDPADGRVPPLLSMSLDEAGQVRLQLDGKPLSLAQLADRLGHLAGDRVALQIAPLVPYRVLHPLLVTLGKAGMSPVLPQTLPDEEGDR